MFTIYNTIHHWHWWPRESTRGPWGLNMALRWRLRSRQLRHHPLIRAPRGAAWHLCITRADDQATFLYYLLITHYYNNKKPKWMRRTSHNNNVFCNLIQTKSHPWLITCKSSDHCPNMSQNETMQRWHEQLTHVVTRPRSRDQWVII